MNTPLDHDRRSPPGVPVAPGAGGRAHASRPEQIEVEKILGNAKEVCLLHRGEAYRLRITANGKLILTK